MKKYSDEEKGWFVYMFVGIFTTGLLMSLIFSDFHALALAVLYLLLIKPAIIIMDFAWSLARKGLDINEEDKKWEGVSLYAGIFWPVTLPYNFLWAMGLLFVNLVFK